MGVDFCHSCVDAAFSSGLSVSFFLRVFFLSVVCVYVYVGFVLFFCFFPKRYIFKSVVLRISPPSACLPTALGNQVVKLESRTWRGSSWFMLMKELGFSYAGWEPPFIHHMVKPRVYSRHFRNLTTIPKLLANHNSSTWLCFLGIIRLSCYSFSEVFFFSSSVFFFFLQDALRNSVSKR